MFGGCFVEFVGPICVRSQTRFVAVSPADSKRGIQCMTSSGSYGVWLAGQGSSKVLLYHATTYEQLVEVNIAPAVGQKLQSKCVKTSRALVFLKRTWHVE